MTTRGWETVPSFLVLLYNEYHNGCKISFHLWYNHYTEQSTIEPLIIEQENIRT